VKELLRSEGEMIIIPQINATPMKVNRKNSGELTIPKATSNSGNLMKDKI